jgi:hypothetical protein
MRGMVTARPFLSRPEQILYGRLVRAFPGHVILAHVALTRLPVLDQAATGPEGKAAANRYKHLVADFVVCKPDFTPLAVVELDDRATPRDATRDRHRRKDQLLQSAGIKVVRLPANDIPNELALKTLVATIPLNSSTAQLIRRAS